MQKPKKPDIIVSWPNNCDYPLWRQFIRDNRYRFNKVIIGFTETNQSPDYKAFVVKAMSDDNCTFFKAPIPSNGADWRDLAVNKALQFVESEWVWFTEQDFFVVTPFWDEVNNFMHGFDVITMYQGDRMHPCCLFARTEIIDKNRRNFGIVPNKLDHFGLFTEDLKNSNASIATISDHCYNHYNGLSSNFTLLSSGQYPNYEPDKFAEYLYKCQLVKVPVDSRFTEVIAKLVPAEYKHSMQSLRE